MLNAIVVSIRFILLILVGQKQVPRQLLRQRAGPVTLSPDQVRDRRHDRARNTQPDVGVEILVFRRHNRLLQEGRNLVVRDDDPTLGGKIADDLAVGAVDARDGARRVVVERRDLRQIARVGEEYAAADAGNGREDKSQDDGSALGDAKDDMRHAVIILAPVVCGTG